MRKGFLSAATLVLGGLPAFAQQHPAGPAPVPSAYYASGGSASYLPRAFFPNAAAADIQTVQPAGPNSAIVVMPPRTGAAPAPRAFRSGPATPATLPATLPAPSVPLATASSSNMPVMPAVRGNARSFLPQTFFPTASRKKDEPLPPAMPPDGVIVSPPNEIPGTTISGPVMMHPPVPFGTAIGGGYGHRRGPGPAALFDVIPGIAHPLTPPPEAFHRPHHESCWIGADYLLAWIRRGPLNTPILTTSTSTDPNVDRGAVGEPGTVVLFGNEDLSFGTFSGFRLEGGLWLDDDNHYSVDAAFFWLAPQNTGIDVRSNGTTLLGRPIFNVAPGQFDEDVFLIADSAPATGPTLTGAINIDARSQLYGGEVNGRWHCYARKRFHGEALLGFRSMHLGERLSITDSISSVRNNFVTFKGTPVAAGDVVTEQDLFDTSNTFYGFQFGGRVRWECDWAYLDAFAKVGVGATCQNVTIDGASTLSSGGVIVDRARGGILALPSNIGEHDRTRLGVIPEVGLNVGVDLTDNVRFKAGYSFLVWNQVARPGSQLDRSINTGQVPADQDFGTVDGLNRPRTPLGESLLWMQTLNFGLELHY
jgi:hypothetical protein